MPAAPASPNTPLARAVFQFGDFVLDVANARLCRAGSELAIKPKSMELLTFLLRHSDQLVLKDDLLDHVWGRRFVSESAVKTVVSELRAVLGDDASQPRWIQTVQGKGYRFIGELREIAASTLPAPTSAPGLLASDQTQIPGNLPTPVLQAIGRDEELAALLQLSVEHRLLSLVGPAGVGKTFMGLTLSQALRKQRVWPDGAWMVELASMDAAAASTSQLVAHLAHSLQLAAAAAEGLDALAKAMKGMHLLLFVDNAEHVLTAFAPLLGHLHAHVPGLRCLVTSREPLQLPGEQVYRLGPLALPALEAEVEITRLMDSGALRMFVDRVAARLPGFVLQTTQQDAAIRLCHALDGLPLALELAAARVPTLGLQALADALGQDRMGEVRPRLRLLTQGANTAAPHQRSLRATLAWSHQLLSAAEQRVFRRLAVFRGGFGLVAAQQVCDGGDLGEHGAWQVLDALDALVSKSMLIAPDVGSTQRRFVFLQSLQAYAQEQLEESGELEAVRARHFEATLRYWRVADGRALGDPALAWASQHGPEIDNLRCALRWGLGVAAEAVTKPDSMPGPEKLLSLAGHAGMLWHRAGHALEGLQWCRKVLQVAGQGASDIERAGVDLTLAHLAGMAMVLPAQEGLLAAIRAEAAFAQLGDPVRQCYALYLQHILMCRAEPASDRSACIARMGQLMPSGASDLLLRFERSVLAYEARLQGQHQAYLQFNLQELARCQAQGAEWEAWSAAIGVMLAEHDCGHTERAIAAGRQVLADIRAAGRLRQNANRLGIWLMMLAQDGDTEALRLALPEATQILDSAGRSGMLLLPLAWLAMHEGRQQAAAELLARFDSVDGTGAEFGPGTYIRRSMDSLWRRLQARIGQQAVLSARSAASKISEDEALCLQLAQRAQDLLGRDGL